MKSQLLLAAAGMGTRLGGNEPKALLNVGGRPLLVRTLERLAPLGLAEHAVVTAPSARVEDFHRLLNAVFPECAIRVIAGGAERQHSVCLGLESLDADTEIVVIHDAARPFVPIESVRASIDAAAQFGAATVAIPVIDTILIGDDNAFLQDTPDRHTLWACQTPQTFRVDTIREAHRRAAAENYLGTDDASLVRRYGGRVKLVMGSPMNFKITTPADLALARLAWQEGLV